MCWNLPVSMAAACYGLAMSYYFAFVRKHSPRDPWYGAFLTSFTLTQLLDSFFWALARGSIDGEVPCNDTNLYFTKVVVSIAVFSQVVVITQYPSRELRPWVNSFRRPFCILPLIGAGAMAIYGQCTYSFVTTEGMLDLPTLVYWGFIPTRLLFTLGVAMWAIAALLFISPVWAATNILIVGGLNLVILTVIDGTILLVSKLCFYCLLLSVMWLLEPMWTQAPAAAKKSELGAVGQQRAATDESGPVTNALAMRLLPSSSPAAATTFASLA